MNHYISDLVTRIKNAAGAKRRSLVLPYSKSNKAIANILAKEGFLSDVKEEMVEGRKMLRVLVRYEYREPVLTEVRIVSKPSLRVYIKANKVKDEEKRGQKTVLISTSKGIMSGKDAQKQGLGGELLFKIS